MIYPSFLKDFLQVEETLWMNSAYIAENEMEKDLEWDDKIYYEIPNVVGLTLEEAKKKLINFEIVQEGNGNKIVAQSPKPKEKCEDRSKVRIIVK